MLSYMLGNGWKGMLTRKLPALLDRASTSPLISEDRAVPRKRLLAFIRPRVLPLTLPWAVRGVLAMGSLAAADAGGESRSESPRTWWKFGEGFSVDRTEGHRASFREFFLGKEGQHGGRHDGQGKDGSFCVRRQALGGTGRGRAA